MRRTRWVGAAAAILLATAAATASTQVAQAATSPVTTGLGQTFGGPAHTFSVPAGYPGGALVKAWSKTLGGTVRTPLIVGSAVVTAAASSGLSGEETDIQAFDGSTGTALWPPLATPGVTGMSSDGQRVFALSQESVLAVDLASGRMLWNHRVSPGHSFGASVPTVYGGLVWVNDTSNGLGLAALDPATGTVVHRYTADSTSGTLALVGHKLYDNACGYDLTTGAFTPLAPGTQASCNAPDAVTQSDGKVVVDPMYSDFTHLSVNDLATGQRLWLAPLGLAALDGGRLLVATARKSFTLTSFDEATGAVQWSIGLPSRPTAQPLVFGGTALISTGDGHLRRYSTATGALVDDTTLTGKPVYPGFGPVNGAMVADSGLLAVPAKNTLNVFRGSTTGMPAPLKAAARLKPTVVHRTGTDHADGSQYAEDAAHDGVATGSTLTGPLHLAWSRSLPGAVSNAVVDSAGRVFVASVDPSAGFDVYRLNRTTGAPIWGPVQFPAGINLTRTRLAYGDGVLVEYETPPLFTGSGGGAVLHSLDPATGALLWTTTLAAQVYGFDSAPTVSGGRVLVQYHDDRYGGVVLAFDLHTGRADWGSTVLQAMDTLAPTAGGGLVYVAGVTNQLYAVDPATGRPAFHADSGEDGGGTASAVYAAGRVYVNDFIGNGSVFDATTGQALDPGMFATRRPAVDTAANAMIALQGNRVTAEQLTDRSRYWTVTVKAVPSVAPVIANGMVITGDDSGRLLVLDEATGRQLWSDPNAFAPSSQNLLQEFEPAQLTVGAGGLAVTSGSQLRFYAGAVDNGPATP